ncbi:hypothetical protein AB0I68_31260 [Streptomyces sp. NPDC050448]|uniref:hypothetical protein n=1 Tax=Streptomyces sp. NPDC050448 TaxID=3155404 RepID=UPI0034120202
MSALASGFIRNLLSSTLYRPDGSVETARSPAVSRLAHRRYSGSGRLGEQACRHFDARRYARVLERYEGTRPEEHLLGVQAAFLQTD